MKNDDKHIEELFRSKFSDYEIQPSGALWEKVARKLSLKEFLTFSPGKFNIYYLMVILSMIALSLYLITRKLEKDSGRNNGSISTGDIFQFDSTGHIAEEEKAASQSKKAEPGNKNNIFIPEKNTSVNIVNDTSPKADKNNLSGKIIMDQNEPVIEPEEKRDETSKRKENQFNGEGKEETLINFMIYPKSGCAPLNVRLENYSRISGTFEWYFGDGGKSDQKNPVYLFDEAGKYKITLSVFIEDGSLFSATKTIEVFEKPKAAFEIYHENILNKDKPVVFLNYSIQAEKFLWSFGDGTVSEEISPEHYYKQSGNFNVELKVWSENGCMDSTLVTNAFQSINGKIEFPTAFLPNLNGPSNGYYTQGLTTNEVFHPDYEDIAEYHLKIYSRSGILIFESKDVKRGWDGYINGSLAKQGVYVWKARGRFINGQTFVKFGNVTLIKK